MTTALLVSKDLGLAMMIAAIFGVLLLIGLLVLGAADDNGKDQG